MNKSMRILLVTEEISIIPPSGGIGAAFLELAQALARAGHAVDLLFVPTHHHALEIADSKIDYFADQGIRLITPDFDKYVHDGNDYSKKTYTIYRTIQDIGLKYDTIHFHDFKGLGFATQAAKRCGLDFEDTTIVVQLHGATAWTIDVNNTLFTHPDQLRLDYMERCSIEWADQLVSPSQYLLEWLKDNDFKLPTKKKMHVIPNVITGSIKRIQAMSNEESTATCASEIIMFGRHEERKGLLNFLKAIQILEKEHELHGVRVTLLGSFGDVAGRHSGLVITDMMKTLTTDFRIIPNFSRSEAMQYLAEQSGAIVVIPSPIENLPYTVMESVALGKPTLSSKNGGGPEMIAAHQHESHLFEPTPEGMAETIRQHLNGPLVPTTFARPPEKFEQEWVGFHTPTGPESPPKRRPKAKATQTPRVTLGITHYERPQKLLEAVWTAIRQDYPNLEIIVVDDGSTSDEAKKALKTVETILNRFDGRVVRQENAYLGAARNTAARTGTGDYLIFLDDDDLAFGHLVSTMVRAALMTGSEVVNCPNLFMEESRRREGFENLEEFNQKVSYFPLGGPLSLGTQQNVFGSATALIRRDVFDQIGGYTELRGVGYEDFEFMLKVAQAGGRIEICPEPLYLYEVDRPSMISQTSTMRNYRRIVDARQIAPDDKALHDILNLNAGQRSSEDLQNRRSWEAKINSHSDIIAGLGEAGSNYNRIFQLLSEYADRIGAGVIKRTWASGPILQIVNSERPKERTETVRKSAQIESIRESSDEVVTKLLSLILVNRPGDTLAYLETKLNNLHPIPDATLDWFSAIANPMSSVSTEHFDKLCALFLEKDISSALAGKIISNAAIFTNGSSKKMPLTLSQVRARYEDAEQRYRDFYPEVDDAIRRKGLLPDAMEHYKRHGFAEERIGFDDLKIAAQLVSLNSVKIFPWELPRKFGFDNFQQMTAQSGVTWHTQGQRPVVKVDVA